MTLPTFLVNGEPASSLDLRDRGLAYGHGLFETMRVVSGRVPLWDRHLNRMQRDCQRLGISLPNQIASILQGELGELFPAGESGLLKITITAGVGSRGYHLPAEHEAARIVARYPLVAHPQTHSKLGVSVRSCHYRLPVNPVLAGVKHLNRLDQVIARAEWQGADPVEGLLCDTEGHLVEGITTNLFGVLDNRLLTPAIEKAGVRGVMRDYLLQRAGEKGITGTEVNMPEAEFKQLPELFICNSVIGVWPVTAWDQQHYQIGRLTRQLQAEIKQLFVGDDI